MSWLVLAGLASGFALLAGRFAVRRQRQDAAADASGLVPVRDLTHLPRDLQRSALWSLADGGFEQRVVHGVVSRGREDVDLTAFDLETLRERRGEWAYLPVEPAFRIAGRVSVCVGQIDRRFPHTVLKRAGLGDLLLDDGLADRAGHVAKLARDGLGIARSYPAELPVALPTTALREPLPPHWRAYATDPAPLLALIAQGFSTTLDGAGRRDLVVELIGGLVIVYPAGRDAEDFADLTGTALAIIDGVLACSSR